MSVPIAQLVRERDALQHALTKARTEVEALREGSEEALYEAREEATKWKRRYEEAKTKAFVSTQAFRTQCLETLNELADENPCDCPPEWPRCELCRAKLRIRALKVSP